MSTDLSAQRYLTLAQAAAYLQLTPVALQKRMQRRGIPAWTWNRIGRTYRFNRLSLDEWMDAGRGSRKVKAA